MKKYLSLLLGSCLLAGCGITDFSGSRTGNESQFLMDYRMFNTTDSQILELEKGDYIYGEIEKKSGKLSVIIQKTSRKMEKSLFGKARICLQVLFGWKSRKMENTGSPGNRGRWRIPDHGKGRKSQGESKL